MNPLWIALFLLVPAGILGILQHRQLVHQKTVRLAAAAEVSDIEARIEAVRQSCQGQYASIEAQRAQLTSTREELAAALEQEPAQHAPLDPNLEGTWPSGRPYFYLPKDLLRELGYPSLDPGDRISRSAVLLFGITPAEEAAVNDALREFRSQLESFQLEHAEQVTRPDLVSDERYQEVRFRVPALKEETRALRQEVNLRLREVLGEQRANILSSAIEQDQSRDINPLGESNLMVTFLAKQNDQGQVTHHLRFEDPERPGTRYDFHIHFEHFEPAPNQAIMNDDGTGIAGVSFPLRPNSVLWNYRHLFGDQPLIPPRPLQQP